PQTIPPQTISPQQRIPPQQRIIQPQFPIKTPQIGSPPPQIPLPPPQIPLPPPQIQLPPHIQSIHHGHSSMIPPPPAMIQSPLIQMIGSNIQKRSPLAYLEFIECDSLKDIIATVDTFRLNLVSCKNLERIRFKSPSIIRAVI